MDANKVRVNRLVERMEKLMLLDKNAQKNLINEFVEKKYFENCEFEKKIEIVVFHLLNYALTLDDLIDDKLVELFRQMFAHSEHCYFIKGYNEHCCHISSKLYRSNWLRVYFETLSKVYNYNLVQMKNQHLDFMEILLEKTANRMSINTQYVPVLNFLIRNSQFEVDNEKRPKKKSISVLHKRKVVLLIILILDGQYQSYLKRKVINEAVAFLDSAGIRMHWAGLGSTTNGKNVEAKVKAIFEFCKTLVEAHNDLNDKELN